MGIFKKPEYKALLLDIEGTITSISFVKDVLFPYARENVEKFLEGNKQNQKIKNVILDLVQTSNMEAEFDADVRKPVDENDIPSVAHNVRTWIDKDKKLTALKELQGIIWEDAYNSGQVKGHLYPEMECIFKDFQTVNIPVYIFSSGSVQAQRLLFRHSIIGDATGYIRDYFDTKNAGPKYIANSYLKIAEMIGIPPRDIMFLTDVEKEANAASEAGLRVMVVTREGNAPISEEAHEKFKCIFSLEHLVCS
ncbi:hypothetical protein FO519_009573 [Halicephalobus sp. NKZ332]|nr:hypothetical protein FO519_009573 [Halicephalobus sp. NKZ332]